MAYDYDLFVIGAGSGGVRASRMASSYGANVAIAEDYRVGGTCVIRGCIPKKLMVYAAHFSEDFEDATGFGWTREHPKFDWKTLIRNKDLEIDRLNGLYIQTLNNAGVKIYEKRAILKDPHTVDLDGDTVTADKILIATGAWPFLPDIPGIEHAITSNEMFHLDELPDHMVIVGGGYIACEFASIMTGLGTEVVQYYRGEQILRGFDRETRDCLAAEMRKKGVDLRTGCNAEKIEKAGNRYRVHATDGSDIKTDQILFATGRNPNTAGLGLEDVGVELSDNGAIVVDDYSKSSIDNIYAVGDCTDRMHLTPVALREGMAFASTVFNNDPQKLDYLIIPMTVFSNPNLATVGLTEEEARKRCDNVLIYKSSFRPLKHTLTGRDEKTFMKLVVDGDSDVVLGAHMVGPEAGEIIQGIAIAMEMKATKSDFDKTVAIHPTAAEEFVTMREAAG